MRTDLKHILHPANGASLRTRLWWLSWDNFQTPLPTSGLLAGGAVASLILSGVWGGNFPVNDLDVFTTIDDCENFPATPVRITGIALDDHQLAEDEYQGWYNVSESGYQVIESDRNNLINNVSVSMFEEDLPTSVAYRQILQGFDLNCCQIGIELETDRLIWTPAFEEFLANGQLKVTHLATPYHTAIRLAKKQAELGCFCDLKTEISLLASYVDMVSALGHHNRKYEMYSRFFGKKYHEMYLKHYEALKSYCHVFSGTNQLLLPGTGIPEPGYYSMDLNVPSVYQELRPYFYKSGLQLSSVSMLQMFDKICRPTTRSVTRRRFLSAIETGKLAPICAIQNNGFTECTHHPKSLMKLEKFAKEHFSVICLFNRLGLNVAQQLQAIRTIRVSVERHGLFVLGLLADSQNALLRDATEVTADLIEQIVSDYRSSDSAKLLVEPVDLTNFPRKSQIIELVTSQQLSEEGQRQSHCIGGYTEAVRSGACRIFRMEHGEVITTLQIMPNGNSAEHRARFNKLPTSGHRVLAAELSAYIKNQLSEIQKNEEFMQQVRDAIPPQG